MSQINLPLTSREFKMMLNVDRFQDRVAGAAAFWKLVTFIAVKKEGGQIVKEQNEEETRVTSYLDTPGAALRQHGLILRLRKESATKFNANLKYRSPDRYLSAARDVSSPQADENKFEEDVLPPHSAQLSKSTRVKFKADPAIKSISDVVALFPGVKPLAIPDETPVVTAGGFEAQEVVRKIGQLSFGGPAVKAALSFWYLLGEPGELPMVGEFSFDYEAEQTGPGELEQFHPETVEGVNRFFNSLQAHAGWFNPNLTTKTAFVLDSL